jgi:hypothetical protein
VLNPADAATRGLTVTKLKETTTWFSGPQFLYQDKDMWPQQPPEPGRDLANILPETITGLKKTRNGNINDLLHVNQSNICLFAAIQVRDDYRSPKIPYLSKYSLWKKLVRVTAYCLRWKSKKKGNITPLEKIIVVRALVFHSQTALFRATFFQLRTHGRVNHDSALATLAPFIDKEGLIRLSGRTEAAPLVYETKYPLLLHAKDPMTKILVRDIHQDLLHAGGSRALHTELSKFYWIPKVTTLLRRAYKCVICRRKFARPTMQIMEPLPFFRLPSEKLHLFEFAAVDVAGPYYITERKETHKRWLLVIRCTTIGAVQLEMLDNMNTLSFLMAIERFLAVRPRPAVLLADNGTNFHGGEASLQEKQKIDMSEAQKKLNV